MPGRDKTGPVGAGALTGRGLGICGGNRRQSGIAGGRRYCRNSFWSETAAYQDEKEVLNQEKTFLENRLKLINARLSEVNEAEI